MTGPEHETREPLELLAEEFLGRARAGEHPTVEQYEQGHPHLAEEIRLLFPTLLMMEEMAPVDTLGEIEARSTDSRSLQLGDYRIVREIGRGGMGVVYEAEQESLERLVALKVLPASSFLDANKRARFLLEARSAARLHHSNIVPVYSVGQQSGLYYYAMQFIEGHGLDAVLKEVRKAKGAGDGSASTEADGFAGTHSVAETLILGVWESSVGSVEAAPGPGVESPSAGDRPERATSSSSEGPHACAVDAAHQCDFCSTYHESVARIGLQVAEALAYAHSEGVLHRDIKPSNLILDIRGQAWVTDFGLAKANDSGDLTGTGDVVGTLRYLPPERFDGESDGRTDVYGLGVTLYELLALRPAFGASRREALVHQVLHQEARPLRSIDDNIPRDLETVVHKAMEKRPDHRYASAEELAEDLRRFLEMRPIRARRISSVERLWRWCRRNPLTATCAAVIAGLLVTIALVSTSAAVDLREERNIARKAEQEKAVRLSEAKLREGRAILRSREAGQRLQSLAALRESLVHADRVEVRNEVIAALSLTDVEVIERWVGRRYYDNFLERFAVVDKQGKVSLFTANAPKQEFAQFQAPVHRAPLFKWSRDGRWLALRMIDGRQNTLLVWDIEKSRELRRIDVNGGGFPLSFSDDGGCMVFSDKDDDIVLITVPEGEELQRLHCRVPMHRLHLSPDRTHLISISTGTTVTAQVWDLNSGDEVARLQHPREVYDAAWQPQGNLLATSCGDGQTYLWDTSKWQQTGVLDGHVVETVTARFSHDGQTLATYGWDGTTRFWDIAGRNLLVSVTGSGTRFSRDDSLVKFRVPGFTSGGLLRLHRSDSYRLVAVPMESKGPWEMAFSPDGRWLAAGCARSGARIWCTDDLSSSVGLPSGDTQSVAFDPRDGALLTISARGVLRWALTKEEPDTWKAGPPEIFGPPGSKLALDRNGARRAVLGVRDIFVEPNAAGGARVPMGRHDRRAFISMSPDGRFVATGTWKGKDVRIWDATTGEIIQELAVHTAEVRFSPDGRWLGVGSGGRFSFFRTGSWERVLDFKSATESDHGRSMAFTPDGRFAAVAASEDAVALVSLPDGEVVARFDPPSEGLQVTRLTISPDGNHLTACSGNHFIQVWNLRNIRRRLREWGLDWETGEMPAEQPEPKRSRRIRVDAGPPGPEWGLDRRFRLSGEALARIRLIDEEIAAHPEGKAAALGRRARVLEAEGYALDALIDIRRALEMAGNTRSLLLRRASILQRLRRYRPALTDLETALELDAEAGGGASEFDQISVYLAHGQLLDAVGRPEAAVVACDRALALDSSNALAKALKARYTWDWESGDRGAAISQVRIALDEHEGDPLLLTTLGILLYHDGQIVEAARQLGKALAAGATRWQGPAFLYQGLCRSHAGKVSEARVLLEHALAWYDSAPPTPREAAGLRAMISRLRKELALAVPKK